MKKYIYFIFFTALLGCSGEKEQEILEEVFLQESPPTITISDVSVLDAYEARIQTETTLKYNPNFTRGVCYDLRSNPTIQDKKIQQKYNGKTSYNFDLKNLEPNRTYYVRAYTITTSGNVGYSRERTFRTPSALAVENGSIFNVEYNDARLKMKLTATGLVNNTAIFAGYIISENPNLDFDTPDVMGFAVRTRKTGEFTVHTKKRLKPLTTYYARAYAYVSYSTVTGDKEQNALASNVLEFKTPETPKVEIETQSITVRTHQQATLHGQINHLGTNQTVSLGFLLSKDQNDISLNSSRAIYINADRGVNSTRQFEAIASNLEPNTTYYYSALVISENNEREALGQVYSFQTLPLLPTEITTGTITNITEKSATITGNISFLGTGVSQFTQYGYVYSSTNSSPTLSNSTIINLGRRTQTGNFTSNLTNLDDNTTYYVRAYATNDRGETVYGEVRSFQTNERLPASLTTGTPYNITHNSAEITGNVSFLGTGVSYFNMHGHCYSSSNTLPTINQDTYYNLGRRYDTGNFTSQFSNLQDNTTYYVRAFATNENHSQIFYGQVQTFTTQQVIPAALTTGTATDITDDGAKFTGNISEFGTGVTRIQRHGHCYSNISNAPSTYNRHTDLGSRTQKGNFTSEITNLNDNTIYYVRAYMTDENGKTTYGEVQQFTTEETKLPPSLRTGVAYNITSNSATFTMNISFFGTGVSKILQHGHCISTSNPPTINDSRNNLGELTQVGNYVSILNGLRANTLYYVRAYVIDENNEIHYGDLRSFRTFQ